VFNFTSTLVLCNDTRDHTGKYECLLQRSRGEQRRLTLWSITLDSIQCERLYTHHQYSIYYKYFPSVATSTDDQTSLSMVYIIIGVIVGALLLSVMLATVLMVICIRVTKQSKKFRSRSSRRANMVIHVENAINNGEVAWSLSDTSDTTSDVFEFPKERLVLMDKVLGENIQASPYMYIGTYYIVFQL